MSSAITPFLYSKNSNIPQETIDSTIEEMFNIYAPDYQVLASLSKDQKKYYGHKVAGGAMRTPCLSEEERYYVHLKYEVANLDQSSPFTRLAFTLHGMLIELGFFSTHVEVSLEKGCYDIRANYWHLDGEAFDHSLTICWGSKPKWCTHVLDEKNNEKYSCIDRSGDKVHEEIEASGRPGIFGYFYNAQKVVHRGPRVEDFGEEKMGVNDYRLFLRFTKQSI